MGKLPPAPHRFEDVVDRRPAVEHRDLRGISDHGAELLCRIPHQVNLDPEQVDARLAEYPSRVGIYYEY